MGGIVVLSFMGVRGLGLVMTGGLYVDPFPSVGMCEMLLRLKECPWEGGRDGNGEGEGEGTKEWG